MYGESLAHRDCRYADQHRHIKPHPPKHAQVCKRKTASAEYQIRIGGGKIWEGRYRGNECSGSREGGGGRLELLTERFASLSTAQE